MAIDPPWQVKIQQWHSDKGEHCGGYSSEHHRQSQAVEKGEAMTPQ